MHYTDLSRSEDIGANCTLIEIGPFRILVDAGIHPKKQGLDAFPNVLRLEPGSIDYVILTHCHLDHLGALPYLMTRQKQAQIILSVPSMAIAQRMLLNSYQVMLRQREELGIKEYPLYTQSDIHSLNDHWMPIAYHRPKRLLKDSQELEIIAYPAGHIIGAMGFSIKHKHRVMFFTGDVLFENQLTLSGAQFPQGPVDTLVMETTRGLTERPLNQTRASEISRLLLTIQNTLERGGVCLIPVFALGRMQELLAILHQAIKEKKLPHYPVYCSGLGMDLANYFDEISRKTGLVHFRRKLIQELKVNSMPKKWKPLGSLPSPGIYVLSSGMLVEKTTAYNVAATIADNAHSALCFVGYCDPETPGGQLLRHPHGTSFLFKALDHAAPLKAHIEQFDLSGHAERSELLKFALMLDPRAIVLTHGDPGAKDWFMDHFIDQRPDIQVISPEPELTYFI